MGRDEHGSHLVDCDVGMVFILHGSSDLRIRRGDELRLERSEKGRRPGARFGGGAWSSTVPDQALAKQQPMDATPGRVVFDGTKIVGMPDLLGTQSGGEPGEDADRRSVRRCPGGLDRIRRLERVAPVSLSMLVRVMITAGVWELPSFLFDKVVEGGLVLAPLDLRGTEGCQVSLLRREREGFRSEETLPG